MLLVGFHHFWFSFGRSSAGASAGKEAERRRIARIPGNEFPRAVVAAVHIMPYPPANHMEHELTTTAKL